MTALPGFTCVPGCSACCKASLVLFTSKERARIDDAVPGLMWTDFTKPGEAPTWVLTKQLETMQCPLLTADGLCSVHPIRPMVCQLYGLVNVPGMVCTKGGKAKRMLTKKEAEKIRRKTLRGI